MVIFARRMNLSAEQMAIVRDHWERGKAIVAMRTAGHAFQPADNEVFDQKVLGGHHVEGLIQQSAFGRRLDRDPGKRRAATQSQTVRHLAA
jgi:hypothetical protein